MQLIIVYGQWRLSARRLPSWLHTYRYLTAYWRCRMFGMWAKAFLEERGNGEQQHQRMKQKIDLCTQ